MTCRRYGALQKRYGAHQCTGIDKASAMWTPHNAPRTRSTKAARSTADKATAAAIGESKEGSTGACARALLRDAAKQKQPVAAMRTAALLCNRDDESGGSLRMHRERGAREYEAQKAAPALQACSRRLWR